MKAWFENCPLIKKVNLLLIFFVVLPISLFGTVLMLWIYQTNRDELYEKNYAGLETGMKKLEECYAEIRELPLECMRNQSLQRIGENRPIGKDYIKVREWLDDLFEKAVWYENICISLNSGKQFQAGAYVVENTEDVYRILGEQQEYLHNLEKETTYSLKQQEKQENMFTFYAEIDSYYAAEKVPAGTLSVRIREEDMRSMYVDGLMKGYEKVCLLDENGQVISASNKEDLRDQDYMSQEMLQNMQIKRQGRLWHNGNILLFRYSTLTGWALVEEIPLTAFYGSIFNVLLVVLYALVLCFVFCVILSKIQKKYVIRPIYEMVDALGEMEQAEFVLLPRIRQNDEIGKLQRAFNQMAERLDTLINKIYRIDYEKQAAELRALTEQINPHFLYNTLDSIHWKAIRNKDHDVAEQILALSDIYRYLLNSGNEFLAIKDEVKFLDRYMFLLKMRFGNRIEWKKEVDEDTLILKIPKLIVQPLIENAVSHGIEPSQEGGQVSLRICRSNADLTIEVCDTGIGFAEEVELDKHGVENLEESFALKNINHRLKVHYEKEYDYFIKSVPGKGTRVQIRLCLEANSLIRNGKEKSDEAVDCR